MIIYVDESNVAPMRSSHRLSGDGIFTFVNKDTGCSDSLRPALFCIDAILLYTRLIITFSAWGQELSRRTRDKET